MHKIYKPEVAVVIVFFSVIAGFIFTLGWFINSGHKPGWLILITVIAILSGLGVISGLLNTRIIIDETTLTYTTLFASKIIFLNEVKLIESFAKIKGVNTHGIETEYKMIISTVNDRVIIPIKPFSRKDLESIAQHLIDNCKMASINQTTINMANGIMPSAFFKKKIPANIP